MTNAVKTEPEVLVMGLNPEIARPDGVVGADGRTILKRDRNSRTRPAD